MNWTKRSFVALLVICVAILVPISSEANEATPRLSLQLPTDMLPVDGLLAPQGSIYQVSVKEGIVVEMDQITNLPLNKLLDYLREHNDCYMQQGYLPAVPRSFMEVSFLGHRNGTLYALLSYGDVPSYFVNFHKSLAYDALLFSLASYPQLDRVQFVTYETTSLHPGRTDLVPLR